MASLGDGACYNELEASPGATRPHWHPFLQALQRLGPEELASRSQDARRLIREHGVTFSVYGDPKGMDRPWGLDLVPLLLTASEWAQIEAGLIQRSRLFNLILGDIYGGAQRLLRNGFLPAETIYGNPAFLRPCRGLHVPSQVYLHLHACDLVRAPDGQWCVLSDRTQAAGGAGYAWENRTVLSRLLPDEMRECNVHPISGFFRRQREMLCDLAPAGRTHPNVVLLTPGAHSEVYFEHAYLARNLGFPLVEGADLTVRDRQVFLKTVEGLEPVDVILRRVDDAYCDPLELRGDSYLGVPGLVDAARARKVTVANALGTGLMESPVFLQYLPALAYQLLGEELILRSVPTWWCGQADDLRYATSHLDQLVIRPAFLPQPVLPLPLALMPLSTEQRVAERARLLELLHAAPHQFVAQQWVPLSRAPAWVGAQMPSRPVILRTFVAHGTDAVAVLPGALARILDESAGPVLSVQNGAGSKDTWVLIDGAAQHCERPLHGSESRAGEHAVRGVPSRAADHLFWLGRYTERVEHLLRVLRCLLSRMANEGGGDDLAERTALNQLAAELGLLPPNEEAGSGELTERMLALVYLPEEQGGVRDLLRRIRTTASAVRDRFSGDTWRILGRLDQDATGSSGRSSTLASATAQIHNLVLDLAAFSGMEMENMTRGHAWRFLDLGRRLERGLSVLHLLSAAAKVPGPPAVVLEPVLEIADSVMTYRRLFYDRPHWQGVLAVVLQDTANPRSLAFQLGVLAEHSAALPCNPEPLPPQPEQASILVLSSSLAGLDLDALAVEPAAALHDLLQNWADTLAAFSDQVTNRYFRHSVPRVS